MKCSTAFYITFLFFYEILEKSFILSRVAKICKIAGTREKCRTI
jgi:hypothetical protein